MAQLHDPRPSRYLDRRGKRCQRPSQLVDHDAMLLPFLLAGQQLGSQPLIGFRIRTACRRTGECDRCKRVAGNPGEPLGGRSEKSRSRAGHRENRRLGRTRLQAPENGRDVEVAVGMDVDLACEHDLVHPATTDGACKPGDCRLPVGRGDRSGGREANVRINERTGHDGGEKARPLVGDCSGSHLVRADYRVNGHPGESSDDRDEEARKLERRRLETRPGAAFGQAIGAVHRPERKSPDEQWAGDARRSRRIIGG